MFIFNFMCSLTNLQLNLTKLYLAVGLTLRRSCPPPQSEGTLTVLETWQNGLMSYLTANYPSKENLTDWTMLVEWNKPVVSRKMSIWNAKVAKVTTDTSLWTITNKGETEMKDNKVQFGMVVDKLEKRDYAVSDLTAKIFFWNYLNLNASCWGYLQQSQTKLGPHDDDISRTRLGIQPDEPGRVCYYGAYKNTNIWKHSGTQYRIHAQVIFDIADPLGEWEVQLVFDEGKKMLVLETPQMVKRDRSQDGQYWSFGPADFNQVIMTKNTKFFLTGAMWRTAPAPESGINRHHVTCSCVTVILYYSTVLSRWRHTIKRIGFVSFVAHWR